MYCYDHPHPAVSVDIAVFRRRDTTLEIVLIRRAAEPFRGDWALPGGFVEIDESLDAAARRELAEETGIEDVALEQLRAFGAPDRDPRERVITVAYCGLVTGRSADLRAASDARRAAWIGMDRLPALAFDHGQIVAAARRRIEAAPRSGESGEAGKSS